MISFSSDWLYPSYQSQEMVRALRARNCDVAYVELQSNYGHDSFLVDVAEQTDLVRGFLASTFEKAGMSAQTAKQAGLRPRTAGPQRLRHHRRDRRAGHQGARPGLRRRRTAANGWPQNKGVEARGVEISGAKVQRAIARGVSVFQGDIDEGLADYPDQRLRLRDPQPDAAGDAPSAQGAARDAARGTARHRGVSEFRPLARAALHAAQRPRAAHQAVSVRVVRFAQHPLPDRARFRRPGRAWKACVVERRYFLAGHRKVAWLPNLLAEVAVFLVGRG